MANRTHIGGTVSNDLYFKLKHDAKRRRQTLAELYEYIFGEYFESCRYRQAILADRIADLERARR